MTQEDLDRFKKWFSGYTRLFFSENPDEQKNIDLKVRHTGEVCSIIRKLAETLSGDENIWPVAEAAGLFHDIGRFPQYAKYKTFRDSISTNHGLLGAEVLVRENVLHGLPEKERAAIINAVRFHNAIAVADLKDDYELFILKMVRDADKLDIWRLFLDFFEAGTAGEIASEASLGLPDLPGYSEEVLASIYSRKTASLKSLRCLNDFRIMLMSWVYDLNFAPSLALLAERNYINRLASFLPDDEAMKRAKAVLSEYLCGRLDK